MIKKIIFDLDDTLIIWNENIFKSLIPTFNELNIEINNNTIEGIRKAIQTYEIIYNYYDKKNMMYHINKNIEKSLPNEFINIWLNNLGKIVPYDLEYNEEVKHTLQILKKKYELVVLTNWFACSQFERLKIAGLDDYFIEIIGTEQVLNKPNRESFIRACGNNKIEECLMIGDNLIKDIIGAEKIGMTAILCDYKDRHKTYNKLKIKKICELKEML